MAEGNFLPNSNKNKLFRFLYNSDDLGVKTADDWVAAFASIGWEARYYPVDTEVSGAEIDWVLERKLPDLKPVAPSKTATEQMDQLKKDIKKE